MYGKALTFLKLFSDDSVISKNGSILLVKSDQEHKIDLEPFNVSLDFLEDNKEYQIWDARGLAKRCISLSIKKEKLN